MSPVHVVVDGSNIATEGRSSPSLRQLDKAVRQFQDEFPDTEPIVVVDATFGHRIDPSERKAFDEAVAHGELVSPPAGAIGRGDAFVLRIAERVGGQVLSNDSFQEFHGEHPWLFDPGRLIGGKPIPGVGWIFTPRLPVRGPRSRTTTSTKKTAVAGAGQDEGAGAAPTRRRRGRSAAVLDAVEAAAAEAVEVAGEPDQGALEVAPVVSGTKAASRRRRRRRRPGDPAVQAAIDAATEEAVGDEQTEAPPRAASRERPTSSGPQAVNDPLTFLTFISDHPLGEEVEGLVSNFVSHGAMVDVGDMHCYVPLSGLGDPPPNSARAVLRKGQTRRFTIVALDPSRRGAQLALVGASHPSTATGAELTAKVSKPAKGAKKAKRAAPAKAAQRAEPAKAAKRTKAAKAGPASAATKAAKATPKPAKATPKPAKATPKPAKAAQKAGQGIQKSAKAQSARPAKSVKAAKAARPAKAVKAAKSVQAKATKEPKSGGRRGR